MLGEQVVKVELSDYGMEKRTGGMPEQIFKVWFGDDKYEYVWAKDELEAYKRATRDERELAVGEHTKP